MIDAAPSVQLKTCCNRPQCQVVREEDQHRICMHCLSHDYKGKFYARKEWEAWINSAFEPANI